MRRISTSPITPKPLTLVCAAALLWATGCAPVDGAAPTLGVAPAALLAPVGACGDDEPTWIAVTTDPGPCPAVPGWAAAPVFPGAGGALARFCHYAGGDPVALLAEPGLVDAGPDCGVVAPQGALDDDSGPVWAAAHAARLDRVGPGPGGATVVVLDTAGPAGSRSPHGPAMVAKVTETAAGAAVLAQVALPRVGDGTIDWLGGGHFGSPGELAQAVVDAAGAPGPLVLNLSLGWAPVAPMDAASMPANHLSLPTAGATGVAGPVRAAHAALVYAACQGALVVAAAGNDPVGAGESGALLPAGWAGLEAPDAAHCAALGFGGPGAAAQGQGLVEAVGGVDLADDALSNGRAGSRPRLVAPAQHAAVQLGGGWHVFSGTSAAAASASGAAAAVWSRDPALTAGAVADALHAGGVDLSAEYGLAELCGPAGCEPVRRLAVCGALASRLPGMACATPVAFDGAALAQARADLPSMPGPALTAVPGRSGGCQGGAGVCPPSQLEPPAAPWPAVAPQPEWPGCPSCSLATRSGTLIVSIDRRMPTLYSPTLTVRTASGKTHYDLSGKVSALEPGDTLKMSGLRLPSGIKSAWMTFTVRGKTGTLSKGNPIAVK